MAIVKTNPHDSNASVADTIAIMGSHADAASISPQVISALSAAGVSTSDSEDNKIQKIFQYVKSRVTFTEDESQLANIFAVPNSKELLITPPVLLSMPDPKGDCDDFSMLGCSMLNAAGVKCDFVTIAADDRMPDQFTHVYCMVTTSDGRQIPFDSSHGQSVGWESPNIYKKMIWPTFAWNKGKGLGMTLRQRAGLGDDTTAGDIYSSDGVDPSYTGSQISSTGYQFPSAPVIIGSTPSSAPSWLTSLLPGVFGAAEKIAIQTTQQPGVQTTGPNGVTTSTVLPQGATSLNIPGLTTGVGSINPLFLIGGVIGLIVLVKSMSK